VGEVFEDADNSFLVEDMDQRLRVNAVPPAVGTMMPCLMGIDVGKWTYLTIGTAVGGKLHVIWMEKIHINQDLATTVLKRVRQFRVVKGVIDAQPDMSTVAKVVGGTPEGTVYGCYYVRPGTGRTIKTIKVDDNKGVVQTTRTGSLDELVKLHNTQMIVYPHCEEMDEVVSHMKNVKRTDVDGNDGNSLGLWQETGPDHWVHALNYLNIAYEMAQDSFSLGSIPVDLSVTGVASQGDVDFNPFKLHH
ncbi:MAG: hypothetical protein KAJ03_05385, partial [Gammaproteobacteria bacterium]|nr:hypothetical protein [Gammaproteobacteria bacterium]